MSFHPMMRVAMKAQIFCLIIGTKH